MKQLCTCHRLTVGRVLLITTVATGVVTQGVVAGTGATTDRTGIESPSLNTGAGMTAGADIIVAANVVTAASRQPQPAYDASLFQTLRYRHVGPYRGGRSTAVAGVVGDILTYYMGSTGGGVWKTTDAGTSWHNVSDGFFEAGSIGAISVAESDPNVVYVGTGSACPRGNVSPGIGMYRSTDAGATWKHIGLRDAGQIGKLAVHPRDPDLVYVAALGHIFGPNKERGVFRSRDAGESWEKVLYLSPETGAVDIKMDANNPRVLYAAFWRAERKPWTLISGGREGGIYKSSDGGDSWEELSHGLPRGMTGRIGVAISPANSQRVWAIIEGERTASGFEHDEFGLYRSSDAGRSWSHVNLEPQLHQRPWYYHHLVADPQDDSTVYHVGDRFWKSVDGGISFDDISVPHGDNHDLWINPEHPQVMIEANDGGANVSFNGGKTWSTQLNQPTAEMYRVTVDNQFPYRLYGGQQDNSTISVPSRAPGSGISLQHWTAVGGGESAHVAVDPRDPNIIYAGTYGGRITRMNRSTGQVRQIMDYPQYIVGLATRDMKYRFQWNAPIRLSPHDPDVLYHTSQHVHRSPDGGQSWELISPDLTRNDDSKLGAAGGPLTHDITGVENYCTVFTFEESELTPGLLWAGSDDGLVHVSHDNGANWTEVTPRPIPDWATINMIGLSAHDPGRVFIAVHNYRQDDFRPYIFRTNDYGSSWQLISTDNGIPDDHFVRVVREDPDRRGLLYAGTEFGLYISFDDGARWQPFQLNLPVTPVTDLAVHQQDLVVATQGRGYWILDDLTPLHQLSPEVASAAMHLFQPRPAYRLAGRSGRRRGTMSRDPMMGAAIENHRVAENPPNGAVVFYNFAEAPEREVVLEILDSGGQLIRSFSSADEEDSLPASTGMNRFVWDLLHPGAEIILGGRFDGYTGGPRALPGSYEVRLSAGDWKQSRTLELRMDPRSTATMAELQEQFDFLVTLRDRITETHEAVSAIHSVRRQMADTRAWVEQARPQEPSQQAPWEEFVRQLGEAGDSINAKLVALEDELRQHRSKVFQDTANFPPLIDDQIAYVASQTIAADARPTDQAYQRFSDLDTELAGHLDVLQELLEGDVELFNQLVEDHGLGAIIVPQP